MTRFADSSGVRIAWDEVGEGGPVLGIHGLGYARWGWGPLAGALGEHFRFVSFDNRGIGQSDVPPGPYTVEQMTEDAVAVLDDAGIARASVVGTSLGGMIAQELAASHPDRVDRLVLLSTTPGGADAHPMPAVTVELMQRSATMDPAEALRAFVANALSPDAPPELVDEILALRVANPPDPGGWASQAAAGAAFDGSDLHWDAPTLVLHGLDDAVVDHRNSDLLAARTGTDPVKVPGGHLVFWEDPAGVAGHILSFLGAE